MFSLPTFALLGSAQGLMLVMTILSINYGNRRANRILATFITVVSLRVFLIGLEYQSIVEPVRFPHIFALNHLSYTLGPLLYFYVQLLVRPEWQFKRKMLWHFSPVLIATLLLIPGGPIIPVDPGGYVNLGALPDHIRLRVFIASMPIFLSLLIYSLLALRELRSYQASIKQQFSALETINLDWLSTLIWFCLLIAGISFVSESYRAISGGGFGPRAVFYVFSSVLLIYYIGLMGLRQPLIFDQGQRLEQPSTEYSAPDSNATAKYQKSGLDPEEAEILWQSLCQTMTRDKPYLTPGIRLADLAEQINTRSNHLSQIINSQAGESFFDYVNRHRIEEAKQALLEQPDITISDIALATGFNSQNVFNGNFKKQMGMTPTQFRRQQKA